VTRRCAALAAVAVGTLLVATGTATGTAGGAVAAPAAPSAAPAAGRPARGDGVAQLVLRDVELTGIELGPATDPDSSPTGGAAAVVRIRVRDLRQTQGLRLTRPVPDGALRVTTAGTSSAAGVVLDATWACVRGLGVTSDGLLRGVLDEALNDALDVDPARGFRTTPVVVLANLVGALGVPVVVRELRADVALLRADALRLPAGSIVRTTVRAPAEGTCGSSDAPAAARPVAEATLAQTSLSQLRTRVRELRRLPARLPSGPQSPRRQP
jgi:hypothetical protein